MGETVDPLAPENYAKMKEENEKSNAELHNAEQILNELRENIALMRERLETTIQMNAHKIHKKFEQYMEQFHFEGKVEWNMDTNKHGDMRYYLYIKARKKGHRGKMEDISAKGRGGKVGSGVSGGEESLSSLLFALALLQTIEASPGYIILDEYDSALDDSRKEKVFTLFEEELNRKMIIVSPKSHDPNYLQHFSQALTVMHDASVPVSRILQVKRVVEENKTVISGN
ncbi:ATP-binding cassette domain-containing protein [Bacillus cereus]|uniref:ATP-binding cassette domain-containing protein n=1 Tax=Bacillus cereus TaxID=1396 RepID=UPI0024BD7CA9|nr:ABC transporter ATP-binding protein [Bacillus cereus]